MPVVADTSPLNYLVLIGRIDILPSLFDTVLVPEAVRRELDRPETPDMVRAWLASAPPWLRVHPDAAVGEEPALPALDEGEREAILLGRSLCADLIIMDDRAGVAAARAEGFAVVGTLGLIELAGGRGLMDLPEAVARLRATHFRCRPELLDALLTRHRQRVG
ncbi:putative nucleic acid-binding protein [Methylobacterium sp. BE186]|uniref:DUF3368 domain-containing protein n=1 Tax=Methylobacterium sp. BE186 TaxID=2817715 RepID=UPI00285B31D3|nr:DUF3368 domain-containing protein [Methylobacterium sp. BE186]MDR7038355.1 putative nucleic acid-binding protein [Methylobacterium sp. BE186]